MGAHDAWELCTPPPLKLKDLNDSTSYTHTCKVLSIARKHWKGLLSSCIGTCVLHVSAGDWAIRIGSDLWFYEASLDSDAMVNPDSLSRHGSDEDQKGKARSSCTISTNSVVSLILDAHSLQFRYNFATISADCLMTNPGTALGRDVRMKVFSREQRDESIGAFESSKDLI